MSKFFPPKIEKNLQILHNFFFSPPKIFFSDKFTKIFFPTHKKHTYISQTTSLEEPPKPISKTKPSLLELNPLDVAKQLTLIESFLFKKITPKELSHQSWNKPDAKIQSPYLIKLIERFNDLSYWIATEIVTASNLKMRVTMLKRFVYCAEVKKKGVFVVIFGVAL